MKSQFTFLLLSSLLTAKAYGAPQQALTIDFAGEAGQRLYTFLGQHLPRTTQTKTSAPVSPDEARTFSVVGDTTQLGCSEFTECILSVREKEWKFKQEGGVATYDFIMPAGDTSLHGKVSIFKAADQSESLSMDFTDLKDGSIFHFGDPIRCASAPGIPDYRVLAPGECHYVIGPLTWTLRRLESSYVLDNSKSLVLSVTGAAAEKLYQRGYFEEVLRSDPLLSRVILGPNVYCWRDIDDYTCQAKLKNEGKNGIFRNYPLRLIPSFKLGMLDSSTLFFQDLWGSAETIIQCPARGQKLRSPCRIWYDSDADFKEYPIFEDSPSGIAVGWGVVGSPELTR